jgi:hypothetical protein
MGKGRFLNQKLGKRTNRKLKLLKTRLRSQPSPRADRTRGIIAKQIPNSESTQKYNGP